MKEVQERAARDGREPQMDVAVVEVGHLMALSARTAPKAIGKDYLDVRLLSGADVDRLGDAMVSYGESADNKGFVRDGRNVKASAAVLLVGLKDHPPAGLDCNGCGFGDCKGFLEAKETSKGGRYQGPACILRVQDLGIAVGSAARTAQMHNVDNRVMYRPAVIAIELGLVSKGIALAIPLSATGKSPFFDRA
jgi:uncharacterized ferredoxin-like protein